MQILWLEGVIVPDLLMMAKITCNGPNKNTSLTYFQTKQKSEESKQGEQSKRLQK